MAKKIAVVKENATRKIHVDLMHDQNKKTKKTKIACSHVLKYFLSTDIHVLCLIL